MQASHARLRGSTVIATAFTTLFLLGIGQALAVQSPPGCTADNSVVNISSDVALAGEGDTITFTVSAGNPASADGCDITNRTMTLTLPDGSQSVFGPSNFPNGTPVASVGSAPYVADSADASGGVWTAEVSWTGTLKNVIDQNSSGEKGVSVLQVLPLEIEKTADTAFDRDWTWSILKTVDEDELLLAEGESFTVNYDVVMGASSTDSNHVVSGTVTITNPDGNPDANITSIADELDAFGAVALDCDVDAPTTLAGGDSINCTYSQAVPDKDDTENEVTVVTTGAVPGGTSTAAVSWGDPENVGDECAEVSDTNPNGPQNELVCADDLPKTFEYEVTFGPASEEPDVEVACDDDFNHPNTASFLSSDTETEGSDDANVHVVVSCERGCTLTQGYWKTHSDQGPAPYDDNWANIPTAPYAPSDGDATDEDEGEGFFLSGGTWLSVFGTAPKGNSYYQLAHQYMAAVLNTLNGASVPANVTTALNSSLGLLNTKTPAQVAALKGQAKSQWVSLAGTLGAYNEGKSGVPHCSE